MLMGLTNGELRSFLSNDYFHLHVFPVWLQCNVQMESVVKKPQVSSSANGLKR